MFRPSFVAALSAIALFWGVGSASAAPIVVNQGFNATDQSIGQFIAGNDGGVSQGPFYGAGSSPNDNAGTALKGFSLIPFGLANNAFSFTFNAAAVFGPGATGQPIMESAQLFLDFIGAGVFSLDVNGTPLGNINSGAGTGNVPLVGGGSVALLGEDDNLFINLPSSLFAGLQTDTTFSITLTRVSGAAIFDGANIQAVVSPEPTSLALFGGAALAAGYLGWRRRKPAAA